MILQVLAVSAAAALSTPPACEVPAAPHCTPLHARATAFAFAPDTAHRRPFEPDHFLAEDKGKHFAMSFTLALFGYAGARTLDIAPATARPLAAAGALAIGIAKEINDYRTHRDFSARDVVVDALGVGLGILLAAQAR
jgi:hypothetical protein